MQTADFDYELPPELIASDPLPQRDAARLMHIDRRTSEIDGWHFYDLPQLLKKGDVLVFNQSKVIPARIIFYVGEKEVEIFLLKKVSSVSWQVLVRPGKFFKEAALVAIDDRVTVEVEQVCDDGTRIVKFDYDGTPEQLDQHLESIGDTPLPPYIKNSKASFDDYQTVYAKEKGSVAAPTAGLHFNDKLLSELKDIGVGIEFVTLHVGMGTFAPVKTEDLQSHKMHSEWYELSDGVAERLNQAKKDGRRVIAVGTTSVRVLESCWSGGELKAGAGETDIFIFPGYKWKVVDGLITNFHLPKSTLLMLVSSFAGIDLMKAAYDRAIAEKYRFYSFGDGMFIE